LILDLGMRISDMLEEINSDLYQRN